ncbi:YadA-like family protein [Sphingomicrobium lutaoense]|uniref:Trimeric autotransporter adhesin YadA-like C-terminal membrane anchor domain-containing protein n=1 Tax=Sphingomicrobium lutaoense TaxID=515949 RepID=A0A839YZH6_9SPHN|nr:YadA-like family protein [Sphingomicrobium lutaoense]MBB3764396.1 hypothetical protein [Sphingomicrobium lutaoense]
MRTSAPLTLSINAATHGSAQALAGSLTGRIGDRLAVGCGLAGNSGDGKVTAQLGVSIGL